MKRSLEAKANGFLFNNSGNFEQIVPIMIGLSIG